MPVYLYSFAARSGIFGRHGMQVSLATGRQFPAKEFNGIGQLVEKSGLCADGEDAGVSLPGAGNALVYPARLSGIFVTDAALFISPGPRGHFDMDDRGVTAQLLGGIDVEFGEEAVAGTRPISESVERPAIAQDDGRPAVREGNGFNSSLHVKDGSLCGATAVGPIGSGKAAAKDNAGCFGREGYVLAKIAASHLKDSGLASAGSAGEDDQFRLVPRLVTAASVRAGR